MSTIPKEIQDKIEEKRKSYYSQLPDNLYAMAHDTGFDRGAIFGYQLATDGREQEGEWISVHDNSDGFRDYLDLKGIEYKINGHFTVVKKEVDIYWLGRQVEEWKQTTTSTDGREELEKENEQLKKENEWMKSMLGKTI